MSGRTGVKSAGSLAGAPRGPPAAADAKHLRFSKHHTSVDAANVMDMLIIGAMLV